MFLCGPAEQVLPNLIGCFLVTRQADGELVCGRDGSFFAMDPGLNRQQVRITLIMLLMLHLSLRRSQPLLCFYQARQPTAV